MESMRVEQRLAKLERQDGRLKVGMLAGAW
jgi:hypothetical protein